jgi:putative drug exporter of the RND superfamily
LTRLQSRRRPFASCATGLRAAAGEEATVFAALGRFSYRFRWIVIAAWAVLLAGGLVAVPHLGGVLRGGGFSDPSSASEQAAALVNQRLGLGPSNVVVVFSGDQDARGAEFQAAERAALAALTADRVPHLQSIQTYAGTGAEQLVATDGHSSVAVLTFDAPSRVVQEEIGTIRGLLRGSALTTYVTGGPAVDADLTAISVTDLRTVELLALPVALLVLLFVFGSVTAAALPVMMGGLAVSVTLGVIYVLARLSDMSIFVMNTATLLGLAVSIDYALFMVARFREELHTGAAVKDAVITTAARAGRSVFFSGVAVMVGVLGLTFFPFPGLRSIGAGGTLVVFFSVAASLTFMPAVLGVLGPRVDALRVVRQRPPQQSRFWARWSGALLKRPWVALAVSAAMIVLVTIPVLHVRTEMPSATSLPSTAESRRGYDILDKEFDRSALSPISVLVTWQGGSQDLSLANVLPLYSFGQELKKTPGVTSVLSVFTLPGMEDPAALAGMWEQLQPLLSGGGGTITFPADQNLTLPSGVTITSEQLSRINQLIAGSVAPGAVLYRVVSEARPSSTEAQRLTRTIASMDMPAGFQVHVAGEAAAARDFFQGLSSRLPWVMLYVLSATYLVLLFMLRSLLLPLKAVLVNAATFLMSFGVVVFVFQDGHFARLLHVTLTGSTDAIIPVVIFCALFGISMDYGVFSLTRVHEAYLGSGDNRLGVRHGLVQSGRVILSAALLVVVVTAAFVFTSISLTKMLGLGIAVAIVLDALLVRLSLVPALMCYLGRANWWLPAWLERLLPDTGQMGVSSGARRRSRLRTRRPHGGAHTVAGSGG